MKLSPPTRPSEALTASGLAPPALTQPERLRTWKRASDSYMFAAKKA